MRFGSVCSGIEAASVAFGPLGWRAAWFAEVDKAANKLLAHRFPHVANHGDMTLLAGMVRRREIEAPDVLCGGTPCQAFSIAGRRGGLSDSRGQLTIAFVDLADAIDEVRHADGKPPCIIIWENVPGVLTSKDNAFGCFLAGLAGESDELRPAGRKWTNAGCVLGPERAVAWRTLDAQFFGLAQRRRRVFVIASARDGFDPTAILFEREGVRRDSPPSREAGEGVAGTLDARTDGGGFPGTDGACSGHVVPAARRVRDVATVKWPADVCPTLDTYYGDKMGLEDQHIFNQNGGKFVLGVNALAAQAGETGKGDPPCVAYAIQERAVCENPAAGPDGVGIRSDDVAYTLEARTVPQAVCAVNHGTQDPCHSEHIAFALGRNNGAENAVCITEQPHAGAVAVSMAVRRLMPVECERLQGFPDGWTDIPIDAKGKRAADGPRYKQLGNSWAVKCVHWLGRRVAAHVATLDAAAANDFDALLDDEFEQLLAA